MALFLPVTLVVYFYGDRLFKKNIVPRQILLLVASLVFYSWWDIRFLPLLLCSIGLNWGVVWIFKRSEPIFLIASGIIANLLIIGYFKYKNFFLETLQAIYQTDIIINPLILPIGISFFTFQQISYLIDIKNKNAPSYNLLEYSLYISFFPQLIAGPIVRHDELIDQFKLSPWREGLAERVARGITLFTVGLIKKKIIADALGKHANAVYEISAIKAPSLQESWTGIFAFAFQIYFDFSAYSDMAIGLALIFGISLPINFNSPYKAASLREFWRRWHMTLSRFLRDYLYIPLGGSRHGLVLRATITMVTMIICGLWHGAGWTFILWGAWHGFGLIINFLWDRLRFSLPHFLGVILTFLFVCLSWVFFRAENWHSAETIFKSLIAYDASPDNLVKPLNTGLALVVSLIVFFAPNSQTCVLSKLKPDPRLAAILGLILGGLFLELGKGNPSEFIYFEF